MRANSQIRASSPCGADLIGGWSKWSPSLPVMLGCVLRNLSKNFGFLNKKVYLYTARVGRVASVRTPGCRRSRLWFLADIPARHAPDGAEQRWGENGTYGRSWLELA